MVRAVWLAIVWDSKGPVTTERPTCEYTETELNFGNKEVQTLLSVFVRHR